MKQSVHLSGVAETTMVPLYARALESKKKNHAFYDSAAVRIVDSLDYNFEKHGGSKLNMWGCAARTLAFDEEADRFLQSNPTCSVINLAAGLDDRFSRVDNGVLEWYNIDLEPVMELRNQLIPPEYRVTNIAASILDNSWIDQISYTDNVLIIAEGILMYLKEEDIKAMFDRFARSFKKVTLLIEVMHTWMVDHQKMHDTTKQTGVTFTWGLDSTEAFTKLCPSYKLVREHNFTDGMKRFSPVLLSIIGPILRRRNNRMGYFELVRPESD